jgi:hypothetical protein
LNNICFLLLSMLTFFIAQIYASSSITGNDQPYRQACLKAARDPSYFRNFRSRIEYSHALEIRYEIVLANYIVQYCSRETLGKWTAFQRLDRIGNPPTTTFQNIGSFSGTTLRYIIIADQIKKLFRLPKRSKIVEIGAGFGGQCFIFSQLQRFSKYYIYDLSEAEELVQKVMRGLSVPNTICIPMNALLPEGKIDLLISNYAFSECDRQTQLDYFERVIKKANRGYVIYNQISQNFGVSSLSPNEFIGLLKKNGMRPRVYSEPVLTFKDNLLIVWDKTKK